MCDGMSEAHNTLQATGVRLASAEYYLRESELLLLCPRRIAIREPDLPVHETLLAVTRHVAGSQTWIPRSDPKGQDPGAFFKL